jgi:cupin fold WbuC family metalloprotein
LKRHWEASLFSLKVKNNDAFATKKSWLGLKMKRPMGKANTAAGTKRNAAAVTFQHRQTRSLFQQARNSNRKRVVKAMAFPAHGKMTARTPMNGPGSHVQQFMNCLSKNTCISIHKHPNYQDGIDRWESFGVLKGSVKILLFTEEGVVTDEILLTALDKGDGIAFAAIPSNTYHAVLAMEDDTLLLETKNGTYAPKKDKVAAHWAPAETMKEVWLPSESGPGYLHSLKHAKLGDDVSLLYEQQDMTDDELSSQDTRDLNSPRSVSNVATERGSPSNDNSEESEKEESNGLEELPIRHSPRLHCPLHLRNMKLSFFCQPQQDQSGDAPPPDLSTAP